MGAERAQEPGGCGGDGGAGCGAGSGSVQEAREAAVAAGDGGIRGGVNSSGGGRRVEASDMADGDEG